MHRSCQNPMPKSVFEWWRELPVYNTLGCHSDFKKRDAWTTLVTTSRYLFHQDPGNMIHGIFINVHKCTLYLPMWIHGMTQTRRPDNQAWRPPNPGGLLHSDKLAIFTGRRPRVLILDLHVSVGKCYNAAILYSMKTHHACICSGEWCRPGYPNTWQGNMDGFHYGVRRLQHISYLSV